jgi:SAM-dependent methyltransferase
MSTARYDGLAAWYDEEQARIARRPDAPIEQFVELAGDGRGLFVEIGCGTGISSEALASRGWSVIGVDLSADQLALARARCRATVLADAHCLPFRTAGLPTLGMAFVHTDIDAFDVVMREVGRVLAPDASCTYLGIHPCFVGHHISSPTKSETERLIVSGYRDSIRVDHSDQFGPGIRSRVGAQHVRLAEFLMAFIDAGLVLDRVVEAGDGIVPWMLGVRAHRGRD